MDISLRRRKSINLKFLITLHGVAKLVQMTSQCLLLYSACFLNFDQKVNVLLVISVCLSSYSVLLNFSSVILGMFYYVGATFFCVYETALFIIMMAGNMFVYSVLGALQPPIEPKTSLMGSKFPSFIEQSQISEDCFHMTSLFLWEQLAVVLCSTLKMLLATPLDEDAVIRRYRFKSLPQVEELPHPEGKIKELERQRDVAEKRLKRNEFFPDIYDETPSSQLKETEDQPSPPRLRRSQRQKVPFIKVTDTSRDTVADIHHESRPSTSSAGASSSTIKETSFLDASSLTKAVSKSRKTRQAKKMA